ncbi:Zinc finger MYND domain-containing protein 15 [Linum perenne]
MECSGKGSRGRCVGPATRRCRGCGAVAYCSVSHQLSHWNYHKKECERLEQQMKRVDVLNEFPFTFSEEATMEVIEKRETRCSFLSKRGIHGLGMWKYVCECGESLGPADSTRMFDVADRLKEGNWDLPGELCPCCGPASPKPITLTSWQDYYDWRCIPLHSPVALLLHWPLTVYYATQIAIAGRSALGTSKRLCIHYLGPEKELSQLAAFGELRALFPDVLLHVELIGPAIPESRFYKIAFRSYGEKIDMDCYANCQDTHCTCRSSMRNSSALSLRLRSGLYHDRYREIAEDSVPNIVVSPNAGIPAYPSWLPTIELIKKMNIPAVFTDYCEEACHLAAECIASVTGCSTRIPIQLNPFRQPLVVQDSPLLVPCYSNCFLFGM